MSRTEVLLVLLMLSVLLLEGLLACLAVVRLERWWTQREFERAQREYEDWVLRGRP